MLYDKSPNRQAIGGYCRGSACQQHDDAFEDVSVACILWTALLVEPQVLFDPDLKIYFGRQGRVEVVELLRFVLVTQVHCLLYIPHPAYHLHLAILLLISLTTSHLLLLPPHPQHQHCCHETAVTPVPLVFASLRLLLESVLVQVHTLWMLLLEC